MVHRLVQPMVRAITTVSVPMPIEALTDSYSLFSYPAAAHLKLSAEKETYLHLAYLHEKLGEIYGLQGA